MDRENSRYTLTQGIVHLDRTAVFGPKDVSPVAIPPFLDLTVLECTVEAESLFLGRYLDQCRLSKCFEEVIAETHCLFKQQQEPGQFFLSCSWNRLFSRQHDITSRLQRSVY